MQRIFSAVLAHQLHKGNVQKLLPVNLPLLVLGHHDKFLPASWPYRNDHDAFRCKLFDKFRGNGFGCCCYHDTVIGGMFCPTKASVTQFVVDGVVAKGGKTLSGLGLELSMQLYSKDFMAEFSKERRLVPASCPDLQHLVGFVELKLVGHIQDKAGLADGLPHGDGQGPVELGKRFVGSVQKERTIERSEEVEQSFIHASSIASDWLL